MKSQKIAVVGAGANEAGIGADLVRDGLDVTLIEQWLRLPRRCGRTGLVVVPDETLVTPVRGVHDGGSARLDEGPLRSARRHQRHPRTGAAAPRPRRARE